MVVLILRLTVLLRSYAFEYTRVSQTLIMRNASLKVFRTILPYTTPCTKDRLYLVNGEGNDRETALHGTLVYIVTIYDVITKTARVLCWTYSCPYCIVYICGEWVIYAEPVTYSSSNTVLSTYAVKPYRTKDQAL